MGAVRRRRAFAVAALCLVWAQAPASPGETGRAAPKAKPVSAAEVKTQLDRLLAGTEEEKADAFEKLRKYGPAAAEPVARALPRYAPALRFQLAQLLDSFRAPQSVPAIAAHLRWERELLIRRGLLRTLGHIGGWDSVQALAQHYREETEVAARRDCLIGLADTGDPRAIEIILERGEQSEDAYLRDTALRSLQQLAKRKDLKDLEAWRAWWNHHRAAVLAKIQKSEEEKQRAEEEKED